MDNNINSDREIFLPENQPLVNNLSFKYSNM